MQSDIIESLIEKNKKERNKTALHYTSETVEKWPFGAFCYV